MGNLFENLLVVFIMVSLVLLIYCKMTKKTLLDVIREIKEALAEDE